MKEKGGKTQGQCGKGGNLLTERGKEGSAIEMKHKTRQAK